MTMNHSGGHLESGPHHNTTRGPVHTNFSKHCSKPHEMYEGRTGLYPDAMILKASKGNRDGVQTINTWQEPPAAERPTTDVASLTNADVIMFANSSMRLISYRLPEGRRRVHTKSRNTPITSPHPRSR